jgi:hypothetical protein
MRSSVLFAVLLTLFAPPTFGGEPEINVKAVCKARSADAKKLQVSPDQTEEDCVRDEETAKHQLGTLWASISVSIRNQCQSDARSLGTMGYLDLLTCMQIAEDLRSFPTGDREKIDGAAAIDGRTAPTGRRDGRLARPSSVRVARARRAPM